MARRKTNPFSLFSFQDIITGLCGIMILLVLLVIVDITTRRDAPQGSRERSVPVEDDSHKEELLSEIEALEKRLTALKDESRLLVVAASEKVAPEVRERLVSELNERQREAAALLSQVEDLRIRVFKAREADAEGKKAIAEMDRHRGILETKLNEMKNRKGVTLIPEYGEYKLPVFVVCGRGGIQVVRPLEGSGSRETIRQWLPDNTDMEKNLRRELDRLDRTTHTIILLIRPTGVKHMDALAKLVEGMGFSYGRDPLEEDLDIDIGNAEGGAK